MYAKHTHEHCVHSAMQNAREICQRNNLRLTDLRLKVLEIIWAGHGPVKAYDILAQLGGDGTPAKPPTVYRSLDFLTENGMVHKLNSLNAYVGCSHPSKQHACYFLICKNCQQVKECCTSRLDQAIDKTVKDNAFVPSQVTLEIEGLCELCR